MVPDPLPDVAIVLVYHADLRQLAGAECVRLGPAAASRRDLIVRGKKKAALDPVPCAVPEQLGGISWPGGNKHIADSVDLTAAAAAAGSAAVGAIGAGGPADLVRQRHRQASGLIEPAPVAPYPGHSGDLSGNHFPALQPQPEAVAHLIAGVAPDLQLVALSVLREDG